MGRRDRSGRLKPIDSARRWTRRTRTAGGAAQRAPGGRKFHGFCALRPTFKPFSTPFGRLLEAVGPANVVLWVSRGLFVATLLVSTLETPMRQGLSSRISPPLSGGPMRGAKGHVAQ